MKTYYSDYVNHVLNFYVRHKNPIFKRTADALNWQICDKVMARFDDRDLLEEVYSLKYELSDSVRKVAFEHSVPVERIWKLIYDFSREFAIERELI